MARRSNPSSTTSEDDPFAGAALDFGFSEEPEPAQQRVYTVEEIDRRLKREAHQAAARRAADGGFVTEVIGEPADVEAVAQLARRRLALYSRDRGERERLLQEFAADVTGAAVEVLPAEAVLESERLLEALHMAVCAREGWEIDTPVEAVIERLQGQGRRGP